MTEKTDTSPQPEKLTWWRVTPVDPPSGVRVLGWGQAGNIHEVVVVRDKLAGWWLLGGFATHFGSDVITHWMPLPERPEHPSSPDLLILEQSATVAPPPARERRVYAAARASEKGMT